MDKGIIILSGVSGSGKSTVSKLIGGEVFSADKYFETLRGYEFDPRKLPQAHGACLRGYTKALLRGEPRIVVDNTNTTMWEISPYSQLAMAYKRPFEVWVVIRDFEECIASNTHQVPAAGLRQQRKKMQALMADFPPFWPKVEVYSMSDGVDPKFVASRGSHEGVLGSGFKIFRS